MAVETTIVREQALADATHHPAGSPFRDPTVPRPDARRLIARRGRSVGGTLALIGVVAVGGPLAVAAAGTILLLAGVLAGPFFLSAILVLALALLAILATGAAG